MPAGWQWDFGIRRAAPVSECYLLPDWLSCYATRVPQPQRVYPRPTPARGRRPLIAVLGPILGLALAAVASTVHALPEELLLTGMKSPTVFSVAVDAGGTIHTLDNKDPNAVRRITPGGCEMVLATSPRLDRGRGLAVGANGNVYASASASHNLLRIQPDGTVTELMNNQQFVTLTGVLGNWLPLAIAVDDAGEFAYVTDSASSYIVRIQTTTGAASIAYPRQATATRPADPLIVSRGIAVDHQGNVFVAAGLESALVDRVIKIPADGTASTIVLQDDPVGIRADEPYSVRVDAAGDLYVAAFKSNNVLRVTSAGAVSQIIGPQSGLVGPRDVAVGPDGTVYVASAEAFPVEAPYGVYRVPPGGSPERIDDPTDNEKLKRPKGIGVDHRGNVYITGELSGTLVRIATQPGTCGNGIVEAPDETCDYAAGSKNCCCTVDCTYQTQGAACSSDSNECTDDMCNATGACTHAPHARPCTTDGLFCTGPEVCHDGACIHSGDPCTANGECSDMCSETGGGTGTCFSPAGTPCAEDANPCTETQCDGTGRCNAYAGNAGDVCRAAAGNCDIAESCTGLSPNCPPDQVAQPTMCRVAAGECDIAELCDGVSPVCPADLIKQPGTLCSSGTCNTAGACQRGGDGGGTCGDGIVDEGEECDLGTARNGLGENGESCCSSACLLQPTSFRCRFRDSVCQKDRTCAGSQAECPAGFPSDADDQICSAPGAETVNGCTLFRCHEGQCAEPICAVTVEPVPAAKEERLPRAFTVTCRNDGRAEVGACGAVGYLDARAIVVSGVGRAGAGGCSQLADRYRNQCGDQEPLYPYCRLVEKALGKDGILTGRCRRIVERHAGRQQCAKWLRKLGQPQCDVAARGGFSPLFRIETTLTNIVSPQDRIATTTVVKLCDRTLCTDAP